jgi:hypothetical protein
VGFETADPVFGQSKDYLAYTASEIGCVIFLAYISYFETRSSGKN